MLKNIKTAKATIELYDFTVTVEGGELEELSVWTTTSTASEKLFGNYATSRSWVSDREIFWDEEELQEYAWSELMRILQKYNSCSIEVTETQVELCDECEERKDEDGECAC
jgi:hypothetical protein